jgi:hypothetical protein
VVLLALARLFLSAGFTRQRLVRALRDGIPHRRAQCAFLFLANLGDDRHLATTGGAAQVRLHHQSQRADYACAPLFAQRCSGQGLRLDRRSARTAPRFGCFLFQLPPSFKYSAAALRRIVAQLDPRRRNVVEFRHRSWWNDDVYRAFADHNIVFCSVSAPRLPDDIIKTTGDVYVRFHGPQRWYRHDYSNAELSTWSQRIRDSGATRVWAYFNNDRQEFAIKNARALLRMLKRG